jgi:hypothetical protein
MTGTKSWEAFRPGELTIPSASNQPLIFLTPGSTDPENPKWVTYPGEKLPLVGKVLLAGKAGWLLVQPPAASAPAYIEGKAVKLTNAARGSKLREHMEIYRPSMHTNKRAVVAIVTELLVANRRPADARTDSFVKFTRCEQSTCGYTVDRHMVKVEKGAQVPERVFYVPSDKSGPIENFLDVNSCYCVYLHRREVRY